MTCDAAQLLIEEDLDGTLSAEQAAALHAHLRECPECARAREDLRRIDAALARPSESPVGDAAWEAMVAQAASRAAPPPFARGLRLVVPLAAAAALVLVCWLGWVRTHRSGPSASAPTASVGPSRRAPRTPEAPSVPDVARPPAVKTHAGPPAGPRHSPHAKSARRRPPAEPPPAVTPPGRSHAPPADALAPDDVYLIYETALGFAREDGRSAAPADLVTIARVQADSGDLAGAIATYEAAVEASVRSPLPSPVVAQPRPNPGPLAVQVPDPPAAVLVAWLPGGE